jgi:hypothetical protein
VQAQDAKPFEINEARVPTLPSAEHGRRRASRHLVTALKPEQDEAEERDDDIGPEDHACVAPLEIVLAHLRVNVDAGGAAQKAGRAKDRRETDVKAWMTWKTALLM